MKHPGAAPLVFALLAALAQARSVPVSSVPAQVTLRISFAGQPGLIYNRRGGSVLSITTTAGRREVKLGGVIKDEHYWSSLTPVRLRLPAGSGPLKLHTRLYVCDQTAGLCSVRESDQTVLTTSGESLDVMIAAPELSRP